MNNNFDLYFAGWYNEDIMKIIIDNNFNQLLSNINDRDKIEKFIEAKKNGWKGKLLIDSGAFSIHRSGKEVPLEDYINYLNKNHEYFDLYVQLDDIPGKWGIPKTEEELASSPPKTWANYLYMISKLEEPKKLLPVFHQGEDYKYLKQMLEFRDENGEPIYYLCLSSNKNLDAKKRYDWYKRCYEIIEQSSNPNIKIHSLGTQSQNHCELIPFTSADATSWILSAGNGNIFTKYGTIYLSSKGLSKKDNVLNNVSYNIFEKYIEEKGFNFEDLSTKSFERVKWNVLYLGNWARYEREYKGPKTFKRGRLF